MWIRSLPEFVVGDWMELIRKLRAEYRGGDYFQQMETVEFLEAYVLQCRSSPPGVREYCRQFTLISQKVTEAGNLENGQQGYWFVKGLPLEYQRHAIAETGADPDRRESFDFYQLQRAVKDRLSSCEGADRLSKMDFEEQSLRQLVKQFRNQQPVISKDATLRLPAIFQPNETAGARQANQETSPAQGYSPELGCEDWQNSTRYPQDSRPPQGSQYPQDSTAFGRPQRDTRGQRGTRGQGLQTCFGCGGSHRFTEYECQGLKDLIQQGLVHLSD